MSKVPHIAGGSRRVRVGVCGYAHEVNALADPIRSTAGLQAALLPGGLAASWEAGALVARLLARGDVEVVELPVWEFGASGPLDGGDFRAVVAEVVEALHAAGPLDGMAILGHGAGASTDDRDTDGTYFSAVRNTVGPDAAIVAVLDFHANVSAAMLDAIDVAVGYRTNPHVDIEDRLVEAAEHLLALLPGDAPRGHTVIAHCATPMVLPQIAQLTSPDEPLGRVVARGQDLVRGAVCNVSVFGGFSLSDTEHCATSVVVTAMGEGAATEAAAAAEELAAMLWVLRPEYRIHTTSVPDAVHEAVRAARGERAPVILADVADNAGGGAPANSTVLLGALLHSGVGEVVMGLHCDAEVVEQAFAAGVGAHIDIEFNRGSERPLATPLRCTAEVLELTTEALVPTRGVYAGSTRHPGRSCALAIGGVQIAVSSRPVQCADDDTLRFVGLRPEQARVVVVKSRGHFRAGFDHLFSPDQIIEVGAPGVATAALHTVEWQHLPRPVWPLDDVASFTPRASLHHGALV